MDVRIDRVRKSLELGHLNSKIMLSPESPDRSGLGGSSIAAGRR
jgi:hypothetical protein